jgi:drug/metabolite transporter (DMT)-like permease
MGGTSFRAITRGWRDAGSRHGLAALTSVVWGLAFVATKLAFDSFSASQLTALRFIIACSCEEKIRIMFP